MNGTPEPVRGAVLERAQFKNTSDEDPVTIVEQGSGAAPDLIKETTTQTFVKDVIEESKRQPVLIDFWAPWCGPCRQLTPIIEKAVRAANGRVKLVKMNIDEHPAIPGQMGIQSIPAVIAFVNGQPVDGFLGALPESQVVGFLERLVKERVGGEEKDLLKAADAALAEGDSAGAADLYAKVLAARGARTSARNRAPRPQMERRRRAQAARPIVRGLGADRRGYRRWPAAAVLDPVCLIYPPARRRAALETQDADERGLSRVR